MHHFFSDAMYMCNNSCDYTLVHLHQLLTHKKKALDLGHPQVLGVYLSCNHGYSEESLDLFSALVSDWDDAEEVIQLPVFIVLIAS